MNRAPFISIVSVIVLGMALSIPLILGAQRLLGHPLWHDSILEIGQRVGKVLPQGVNTRASFAQDHAVAIEPVSNAAEPVRSASRRAAAANAPVQAGTDASMIAAVIITLSIALSVGLLWRSSRAFERGSGAPPVSMRRTLSALGMGISGGVLVGFAFATSRVFWTGVNQSFYERSLMINPQSKSIHVRGDLLLSMSPAELTLMLIGVLLIIVPITLVFASRAYGVSLFSVERESIKKRSSWIRRIWAHPSVSQRFSARSVRLVLCVCYVMLTLALWTAPWSTTMARAIWY